MTHFEEQKRVDLIEISLRERERERVLVRLDSANRKALITAEDQTLFYRSFQPKTNHLTFIIALRFANNRFLSH